MQFSKWSFICVLALGMVGAWVTQEVYSATGRGDFHVRYHNQSVDDLIIQYMESNDIPGMSLAIVQAPYITRVVGYGLADITSKRLVADKTVFNIGQITKAYTAVAVMQLKEEGKLQLDAPITQYLDGEDVPASWTKITIGDLMTHSSGLPDYTQAPDFDFSKDYAPRDILSLVKAKEVLFPSGTKINPSATDFYFLGLIIEKASGMTYQAYVTKNQIERVGLKQTFFISNQGEIKNEVHNGTTPFKHGQFLKDPEMINAIEPATGYAASKGDIAPTQTVSWSATFSNSGMVASPQDISTWDIALAGDVLLKDAKSKAFLYKPVSLKNGQVVPGSGGWFFNGHKGMMDIKGNLPGHSAYLSRFTAKDELVCVTLLANKGDLHDLDILGRKIAGAFDDKLAPPQGADWTESLQSPYSVQETIDRVEALIKKSGAKVFARIDQRDEAIKAGQTLQDTQVILVGNPAKGTALMQAVPAMALDLPLRIMATTHPTGETWLSFTNPIALAKAWHLDDPNQQALLRQMYAGLNQVCQKALSHQTLDVSAP